MRLKFEKFYRTGESRIRVWMWVFNFPRISLNLKNFMKDAKTFLYNFCPNTSVHYVYFSANCAYISINKRHSSPFSPISPQSLVRWESSIAGIIAKFHSWPKPRNLEDYQRFYEIKPKCSESRGSWHIHGKSPHTPSRETFAAFDSCSKDHCNPMDIEN